MIKRYKEIIEEVIDEKIGSNDYIRICQDDRCGGEIRLYAIIKNSSTSFRFNFIEDNFVLYGEEGRFSNFYKNPPHFLLSDLNIFKSVVEQSVDQVLIPKIKDLYKQGYIKTLPSKMFSEDSKIDVSKITTSWLQEKFYEISEDIMNGEKISNVKITNNPNDTKITFDVDCNSYGLFRDGGVIKINDKGFVIVSLNETPIEGCGIESELSEQIENFITS